MDDINYSVLMSVYYKEKAQNLSAAINSVLNQSVKTNDFVIVCDGGLTEELENILEYYSKHNKCIHIYRLKENKGLGNALNYGIKKCINNLVGRMDSDDISHVDRFKYLLDEYKATHADVIGGYIEEFYQDIGDIKNIRIVPLTMNEIKEKIKRRNPINHVTVLMNKKAVEDVGGYLDLPYLEDYYLWVRMIQHNKKICNINQILVYVRTGKEMYNRRGNKKQIKGWYVLQKLMKEINIVSRVDMILNMISITVFVFLPSNFKKIIYEHILRKKG